MECYVCERHHQEARPGSSESPGQGGNIMYLLPCGRTGHIGCLVGAAELNDEAGMILKCPCAHGHNKNNWMIIKCSKDELVTLKASIAELNEELHGLQRTEYFGGYDDYATKLLPSSPVYRPKGFLHCENCFGTHELEACPNDFFIREDVKTSNGNGIVSYTTRIKQGSNFSAGLAFQKMLNNCKQECGLDLGNMSSKFKTVAFTGLVAMTFWNKLCPHCGFPFHRTGEDGSPECLSTVTLDPNELSQWSKVVTVLENDYGKSPKKAKELMGYLPHELMSSTTA